MTQEEIRELTKIDRISINLALSDFQVLVKLNEENLTEEKFNIMFGKNGLYNSATQVEFRRSSHPFSFIYFEKFLATKGL